VIYILPAQDELQWQAFLNNVVNTTGKTVNFLIKGMKIMKSPIRLEPLSKSVCLSVMSVSQSVINPRKFSKNFF
jgi:hypothetical protein